MSKQTKQYQGWDGKRETLPSILQPGAGGPFRKAPPPIIRNYDDIDRHYPRDECNREIAEHQRRQQEREQFKREHEAKMRATQGQPPQQSKKED